MDRFESFNLITIRKKDVERTPGSKRWNLTTKSSSLEHLEPRISCVWWNFLENGQGSFPFVPNHTQPWSDSGSLTYLRARKRRFSDSMARLTFSTQRYTVETRMGNHFSDEKCYHAIEPRLLIARSTATKFQLNLRRKIECRYERKSEWNTFSSCDPSMQKLSRIPWKFFAIYRMRAFF